MRKITTILLTALTLTFCLSGCGNSAELEALKTSVAEKDATIADLNNQINELNATITELQEQLDSYKQGKIDGYEAPSSSTESSASNPYVHTPEEQQQFLDQMDKVTPVTPAKEVTIENCEVSTGHVGQTVYGTQQNPLTVAPDVSLLKPGDQYWFITWNGEVIQETYNINYNIELPW